MSNFGDFMIEEASRQASDLREANHIRSLGIALARRLTRYFPEADKIDPVLDCDIEIRKMADNLLLEAKVKP